MTNWKEYYKTLLTDDREEFGTQEKEDVNIYVEDKDKRVPAEEVKSCVKEIESGKASSPGSIPIELVKACPDSVCEHLLITVVRYTSHSHRPLHINLI